MVLDELSMPFYSNARPTDRGRDVLGIRNQIRTSPTASIYYHHPHSLLTPPTHLSTSSASIRDWAGDTTDVRKLLQVFSLDSIVGSVLHGIDTTSIHLESVEMRIQCKSTGDFLLSPWMCHCSKRNWLTLENFRIDTYWYTEDNISMSMTEASCSCGTYNTVPKKFFFVWLQPNHTAAPLSGRSGG